MRQLQLYLTDLCNLRCVHCLSDFKGHGNHMDLGLLDRLTDEAQKLGIRSISLSGGGEPTLHPEFGACVAMIVRKGFKYSIVSNGTVFERRLLPVLKAFPGCCEAVNFSLDGLEAVHDRFRRAPGNFRQVVAALGKCRELGVETALKICPTRWNFREFPELIAYLVSLHSVCRIALGPIIPVPSLPGLDELILTDAEYDELWTELDRLERRYQGLIAVSKWDYRNRRARFDWCGNMGQLAGLYVTPAGEYGYCCNAQSKGVSSMYAGAGEMSLAEALKAGFRWSAELKARRLAWEATHGPEEEPFNICVLCHRLMREIGLIRPEAASEVPQDATTPSGAPASTASTDRASAK